MLFENGFSGRGQFLQRFCRSTREYVISLMALSPSRKNYIVPLLYQVYLIKGHDLLSYFLLSEKLRKCFILLPVHCRLKCLGGLSFGFEKIKFKMADSKIGHFSKSPILNIFCENFIERSLG